MIQTIISCWGWNEIVKYSDISCNKITFVAVWKKGDSCKGGFILEHSWVLKMKAEVIRPKKK